MAAALLENQLNRSRHCAAFALLSPGAPALGALYLPLTLQQPEIVVGRNRFCYTCLGVGPDMRSARRFEHQGNASRVCGEGSSIGSRRLPILRRAGRGIRTVPREAA